MTKAKKVLLTVLLISICLAAGALITCSILIPAETKLFLTNAWTWLNTPLPVVGLSVLMICILVAKLYAASSFGKKQINEFKREAEKTKEEYDALEDYVNKILKEYDDRFKKQESEIKELVDYTDKALALIPNKKIQNLREKYHVKEAEETTDN